MGKIIIGKNFINYTIQSVSGADANWPAINLGNWVKRSRWWKTPNTNAHNAVLNLGAPKTVKMIGLIDANFTDYDLEFDSDPNFSPAEVQILNQSLSQEKHTDLYRHYQTPTDLTAVNHQYLKLSIANQATTDGDTKFRLGSFIACLEAEEVAANPDQEPGVVMTRNQAIRKSELEGGGVEKATVGLVYAGINFNMEIWREEADFALAMKHLLQIGETQPILLALSPVLLEEQNLKQYVYTLWREGPPQYRFGQFSAAHFDGNDFREPI